MTGSEYFRKIGSTKTEEKETGGKIMERTMVVKGTGRIRQKPDQTVVEMTLKTVDKEYDKAMKREAEAYNSLCGALKNIGFAAEDVKTTEFDIDADYDSYQERESGKYINKFIGYVCRQELELRFDFDTALLSKVLDVIEKNNVGDPDFSIRFAVKDKEAAADALLEDAAANALRKAKVLAKAAGVSLGQLLNVDYNWGEVNFYSHTRYRMEEECLNAPTERSGGLNFTPDDVSMSDSATFVWEIV